VDTDPADAALAEVIKVKETAERLANGDTPGEADQIRVLAGLVFQLAEQVERLEQGSRRASGNS
jgi:hypothetical protein